MRVRSPFVKAGDRFSADGPSADRRMHVAGMTRLVRVMRLRSCTCVDLCVPLGLVVRQAPFSSRADLCAADRMTRARRLELENTARSQVARGRAGRHRYRPGVTTHHRAPHPNRRRSSCESKHFSFHGVEEHLRKSLELTNRPVDVDAPADRRTSAPPRHRAVRRCS